MGTQKELKAQGEELVEEEVEKSLNYENHEEGHEDCMHIWQKSYPIVSWLDNVSGWERFCHVEDPDNGKDLTIVTPNKKAYLKHFYYLIEKHGEWDSEKEIPVLAEKQFKKVDKEFAEKYERIKNIPPHPLLPKVFLVDCDRAHDIHYAQLEFVPGSPFTKVSLGPFQVIRLLHDLFGAAAHEHRNGILHRRIKDDNVYVTHEGAKPKVKFVSWGLAIPKEKAQNDRSANRYFAAPEILLGGKITEQTDNYAIAELGYKSLTGRYSHEERKPAENLRELQNIVKYEKAVRRLSDYRHFQDLSEQEKKILKVDKLEEFFSDLLSPDPDRRRIKTAIAAQTFISTEWSRAVSGAADVGYTLTMTMG